MARAVGAGRLPLAAKIEVDKRVPEGTAAAVASDNTAVNSYRFGGFIHPFEVP